MPVTFPSAPWEEHERVHRRRDEPPNQVLYEEPSSPITFKMVTARYPRAPPLQLNASRSQRLTQYAASRFTRSAVSLRHRESIATLQPDDSASVPDRRRGSSDSDRPNPGAIAVDHDEAWTAWISVTSIPEASEERVRRWFGDQTLAQNMGSPKQASNSPTSPVFENSVSNPTCSPRSQLRTASSLPSIPVQPTTPDWVLQPPPPRRRTKTAHSSKHRAHHQFHDEHLNNEPEDLMDRWGSLHHELKQTWSRLPEEVRLQDRDAALAGRRSRQRRNDKENVPPLPPLPDWSSSRMDAGIISPTRTGVRRDFVEVDVVEFTAGHANRPVNGSTSRKSPKLKRLAGTLRSVRSLASLGRERTHSVLPR